MVCLFSDMVLFLLETIPDKLFEHNLERDVKREFAQIRILRREKERVAQAEHVGFDCSSCVIAKVKRRFCCRTL